MAEIFGNALLNISALSAQDDGLFCSRIPQTVSCDSVFLSRADYTLNKDYMINDLDLWRGEMQHMPLAARGWVLQEQILAARTIYFGSRQVLWECAGHRACETYPVTQRKKLFNTGGGSGVAKPNEHHFLHDDVLEPIASGPFSNRLSRC